MSKFRKCGGYRKLASFQTTTLIYDATYFFCEKFVSSFSRTVDQMVQAARSGRQNIAEGSRAGATSSQTELRLVNVARASLEELLLDYEDFLRHRKLKMWEPSSMEASAVRNVPRKFRDGVGQRAGQQGSGQQRTGKPAPSLAGPDRSDQTDSTDRSDLKNDQTDRSDQANRTDLSAGGGSAAAMTDLTDQQRAQLYSPWLEHDDPAVRANAIICLIHQANYLLDKQIDALEDQFVTEGGYSEQLAAARIAERRKRKDRTDQSGPSDQTDLSQGDPTDQIPACLRCGTVMALRTAKQGKNSGSQFWGCTAYPECRGTMPA